MGRAAAPLQTKCWPGGVTNFTDEFIVQPAAVRPPSERTTYTDKGPLVADAIGQIVKVKARRI